MEFSDRPSAWLPVKLVDIAALNMGQSPSSSDVNDSGEGIVFFQGKAEFGKLHPTPRKFCTAPKKIAESGDILLSVRAPVGPTNVANQTTAIGRGLAAIRAEENAVNPRFLLHYFRCIEPWMSQQGTGTTFKAVSGAFLKELNATLPPLAEQKVIADKLDTLLAQVENTKARLERIPQILKRFRQSVLAAAVSGRLTEEWRGKLAEHDEWRQVSLGDLIDNGPQNGIYKPTNLYGSGCLIIRIDSFYDGMIADWSKLKRVQLESQEIEKWHVNQGDILVNRVNSIEYLGKSALVNELTEPAVFESNIMRLSLKKDLAKPEFVSLFLRSPVGLERLRANAKLAVNQASINQNDVKSCLLALPTLSEQTEIVRRVDQLFAHADRIEQQVNNALARVNNLTQSILAKAFRGELTEQWRKENPELISGENSAQALLQKVKARRAQTGKNKENRASA